MPHFLSVTLFAGIPVISMIILMPFLTYETYALASFMAAAIMGAIFVGLCYLLKHYNLGGDPSWGLGFGWARNLFQWGVYGYITISVARWLGTGIIGPVGEQLLLVPSFFFLASLLLLGYMAAEAFGPLWQLFCQKLCRR